MGAGFDGVLSDGRLGDFILGQGTGSFPRISGSNQYPFYRIILQDTFATGAFQCPNCQGPNSNSKIWGDPRTNYSFSLCAICNVWFNWETNLIFTWAAGFRHLDPLSNKPGSTLNFLPGGANDN